MNPLLAISPIDGRYRKHVEEFAEYFSEFAFIKYRTQIEIKYFISLSELGIIRKLKKEELKLLQNIAQNFSIKDAEENKDIAQEYWKSETPQKHSTKHDVKAVEYFLKGRLSNTSLKDISEFIHFGLTSEDINNLAYRLMLQDGIARVTIPNLLALQKVVKEKATKYNKTTIIARTHGQPAIPTTLGKEFLVFHERLDNEIKILKKAKLRGKLNGAVGNYNALQLAYPKIDWFKFSKKFIFSLGIDLNSTTNQIAPYEDIIFIFQTVQRINGIILDLDQDMWRYISDGWFVQENKEKEIGSSTMPQKINPIMFENSEGNLIVANSLIDGFVHKLPISRLQRDLSGSTISRNFGVCLAHSLIAYKNSVDGLNRIKSNNTKIEEDLNSDWSILAEAVQIILRRENVKNSYEIVKSLTRGKKMTQQDYLEFIDDLPTPQKVKEELKKITPENYIGNA